MRIARVQHNGGAVYAIVDGDTVYSLNGNPFESPRRGEKIGDLGAAKLLAPCEPSKIVAIGRNYKAHIEETNAETPKEPLMFFKPPTSVVGPGDDVVWAPGSEKIDYEAELAVVFKKTAKNVAPGQYKQYVLGYTCANDICGAAWRGGRAGHGARPRRRLHLATRGRRRCGLCLPGACRRVAGQRLDGRRPAADARPVRSRRRRHHDQPPGPRLAVTLVTMATPVSLRLPPGTAAKVHDLAAIEQRSYAEMVRVLTEEAIRMREFPGIYFAAGPTGRRARFVDGPDVWEVLEPYILAEQDWEVLRQSYPNLDERLLRDAVRYYERYAAEIDSRVALNQGLVSEELARRHPAEQ